MGSSVLQIICNLAACVILLLLHVSGNTSESEPLCIVSVKVPRNTVFRAPVMTVLKINCTVNIVNCQRIPKISWCKIYGNDCKPLNQSNYIETEWKSITQHDGISFLTFINISMEDAGPYRCKKGQTTISHAINVIVTADIMDDKTAYNQNNRNSTIPHVDNSVEFWHYVNICRWSVGLTVILTGVSIIIKRVKPKNVKEENEGRITTASGPTPFVEKADDSHRNISTQASVSSDCIYENIEDL